MKKRYLFALDFDNTVIDEDSDNYIFETLSPLLLKKVLLHNSSYKNVVQIRNGPI
jgi:2-hydroxy-3-keto-5-methylthiopentenyl-1-phosphate phosphatase